MSGRPKSVLTDKTCTSCHVTKPLDGFGPDKKGAGGVKSKCRDCRRDEHKDYQWARNLMRHYGLTVEQYNTMLEKQEYRCAICRRHQDEFGRSFAVDHDHETGENRGLLCISCNRGIGYLADDAMRVLSAYLYLGGSLDCNTLGRAHFHIKGEPLVPEDLCVSCGMESGER